jgi:UDP-3-O-[3-hydroxymyristoyl] N-acetylglucosamine deacetylase
LLSDRSAYEIVEAPAARNQVRAREFVPVNMPEFAPWSA